MVNRFNDKLSLPSQSLSLLSGRSFAVNSHDLVIRKFPRTRMYIFVRRKRSRGLLWATDDGFVFVKRRIQNNGNGSHAAEFGDQLMVKRIAVGMDGLQTAVPVNVTDGRNKGAFFRSYLEYLHHEWNVVVLLEPFQPLFRS